MKKKNSNTIKLISFLTKKTPNKNSVLEKLINKDELRFQEENKVFRLAKPEEYKDILRLIMQRTKWMKDSDFKATEKDYSRKTFKKSVQRKIANDNQFVYLKNGEIVGAIVLEKDCSENNADWDNNPYAIYGGDGVTSKNCQGKHLLQKMLTEAFKYALEQGYKLFRFSIIDYEHSLEEYYTKIGIITPNNFKGKYYSKTSDFSFNKYEVNIQDYLNHYMNEAWSTMSTEDTEDDVENDIDFEISRKFEEPKTFLNELTKFFETSLSDKTQETESYIWSTTLVPENYTLYHFTHLGNFIKKENSNKIDVKKYKEETKYNIYSGEMDILELKRIIPIQQTSISFLENTRRDWMSKYNLNIFINVRGILEGENNLYWKNDFLECKGLRIQIGLNFEDKNSQSAHGYFSNDFRIKPDTKGVKCLSGNKNPTPKETYWLFNKDSFEKIKIFFEKILGLSNDTINEEIIKPIFLFDCKSTKNYFSYNELISFKKLFSKIMYQYKWKVEWIEKNCQKYIQPNYQNEIIKDNYFSIEIEKLEKEILDDFLNDKNIFKTIINNKNFNFPNFSVNEAWNTMNTEDTEENIKQDFSNVILKDAKIQLGVDIVNKMTEIPEYWPENCFLSLSNYTDVERDIFLDENDNENTFFLNAISFDPTKVGKETADDLIIITWFQPCEEGLDNDNYVDNKWGHEAKVYKKEILEILGLYTEENMKLI